MAKNNSGRKKRKLKARTGLLLPLDGAFFASSVLLLPLLTAAKAIVV